MESWWFKVKRAQKHMVEIEREIRRYLNSKPYEVVLVRQPDQKNKVWEWALQFTEQPNPMVAVMIGDFFHNLRSALDHVVVASVPNNRKGSANYPIYSIDIWAKDADGNFISKDDEARERYTTAITGLDPLIQTIIEGFQPYQVAEYGFAAQQQLGLVSRLDNADKHKQLIIIGAGVRPFLFARVREIIYHKGTTRGESIKDGAMVFRLSDADPSLTQTEMHVNVTGPAWVQVHIAGLGENDPQMNFGIQDLMLDCIRVVRIVLRLIEPTISEDERKNRILRL